MSVVAGTTGDCLGGSGRISHRGRMRVTTAGLPGLKPVFVRVQLHQKVYAVYLVGTALRGSLEPTNHAANGLVIGVHSGLRGRGPCTFDNDVEK